MTAAAKAKVREALKQVPQPDLRIRTANGSRPLTEEELKEYDAEGLALDPESDDERIGTNF